MRAGVVAPVEGLELDNVALGALVTLVFALLRGWPFALPWWARAGAVAGLPPAPRAAARHPVEAPSAD
ncbi:hypothetical protein [Nocardiopsis lambiniae]|uniref:Uncharacterized protein n=1 Tax=Nocardiopsis lambiniae TaxID=3075539 RepID=A0ABU2MB41_9ACTN|nr:hypothetical protein [Nocardiopsis sp. DSM 44743]MDT0329788.1 hypothetical protein [Nocardiopsis sp. DSM 44743]